MTTTPHPIDLHQAPAMEALLAIIDEWDRLYPQTVYRADQLLEWENFEFRQIARGREALAAPIAPAAGSEQTLPVDAVPEEPAAKALTHEEIAAAGLGLEYVHSVLCWAACGYVHTPERIASLHTSYRIVDKLVNAAPVASRAGSEPVALAEEVKRLLRVHANLTMGGTQILSNAIDRLADATPTPAAPTKVAEPVGEIVGTEKRGFVLMTVVAWEPGFNRTKIGTKLFAHPIATAVAVAEPLTEAIRHALIAAQNALLLAIEHHRTGNDTPWREDIPAAVALLRNLELQ